MEPQVSSQPGKSLGRCRSRSPYETYVYFRRSIKAMAELFAYRVVLNGIVLASSTQETVFAVYMTYRVFAGQGRLTRLRAPLAANVNRRRVYGGYISRGLSTVGARHGWGSAGRRNAAHLRFPPWWRMPFRPTRKGIRCDMFIPIHKDQVEFN